MSKPHTPTLGFPASSPKWCAYCARAGISSTLISAAAANFPAGRRHWPTPRCGRFRNASSIREVLRALEKNSQRSLELIGRLLPAFLRPFGRRFAGVPGTGLYRDIENGNIEYRMYCFTKD